MFTAPIDTIWNNIWLTSDLINIDAVGASSGYPVYTEDGNLSEFQPTSSCEGGSENIMGLVSGANIYIANTRDNGARNKFWDDDIVINAGLIALKESFVIQYWQNTTTTNAGYIYPLGTQAAHDPPWGDGRGDHLPNGIDNNDY